MKRAFICYNTIDSKLVIEVSRYLKQNFDDIYYYEDYNNVVVTNSIVEELGEKIYEFEVFIAFIGKELTPWQINEIRVAVHLNNNRTGNNEKIIIPVLVNTGDIPGNLALLHGNRRVKYNSQENSPAYHTAREIVKIAGLTWKTRDKLPPVSNYFYYEKNILKDYINLLHFGDSLYSEAKDEQDIKKIKTDLREKLLYGLPPIWPSIKKMPDIGENYHNNTLREIGEARPEDAKVVAAALSSFHPVHKDSTCIYKNQLTFPEAGPREKLFYPRPNKNLRVAILVSGGIAPGINSVINGITQRHEQYANNESAPYKVKIYGLKNGFYAFDNYDRDKVRLNYTYTSSVANENGSCIGTSRDDRLLTVSPEQDQNEKIIVQLLNDNIDILYIIGGDGSMKAAHALWNYSKEMIRQPRFRNKKLSVVGIPKTMDNDILWVWQTFGFLSAVEKAREIIEQLSVEVISNPRICIVQLFGSDSGFVVSHAVVASKSTVCDAALIPEVPFTMKQLTKYLKKKIEGDSHRKKTGIPMSLVVMAETAIPVDALDYIDDPEIGAEIGLTDEEEQAIRNFIEKKQLVSINKRNDLLRAAGLKIVSRVLKELLPKEDSADISWSRLRVFTNEPRHILRAISPSCSDTIMGNRLGTLAVDNALAGYMDFMISQWLTEFVLVPLELVILGKKRIPTSGIFWKSVTTKTGQPDLVPVPPV